MPRLPGPVLRTERLVLRTVQPRDAVIMRRALQHPGLARMLGGMASQSVATTRKAIARDRREQRTGARMSYVLLPRGSREVVGYCAVKDVDTAHGTCEVAYWVARPHWGRGYMTEALGVFLPHLFTAAGFFRITATVFPNNRRSAAVLERLGFRCEGVLRKGHVRLGDGHRRDLRLYALLRTDSAARRLVRAVE